MAERKTSSARNGDAKRFVFPKVFDAFGDLGRGERKNSPLTSLNKQLFKPAQAFFGGGGSSGSAASTSAVSAAAASVSTPAAAAAPPQFGFAASATAVAASAARVPRPVSPAPVKKAAAGTGAASPGNKEAPTKKKSAPRGPTAYALFLKEQLSAGGARDKDARSFAQKSAAVAAAWKSLPASSKARFEAASLAAKLALPPREAKPVKALTGYQLFVREKLPTLRDEAAAGGGTVSAMKAVGAAWSSAPAQVKAEFAARAKAMGTKR